MEDFAAPLAPPTPANFTPTDDALGLDGTYPRPGWAVIDAIRDRRFTGEVIVAASTEVRLAADRGVIQVAERAGDLPLGQRLVAHGALSADQLDRGTLRIGDVDHLGRLFDRDPSIDRDLVMATTELIADDCLGWLAGESVLGALATPYRRHPSGVHRWSRPSATSAAATTLAPPVQGAPVSPTTFAPPPGLPSHVPTPVPAALPELSPAPAPTFAPPGVVAPPALPTPAIAPPAQPVPPNLTVPSGPALRAEPAATAQPAADFAISWDDMVENTSLASHIDVPVIDWDMLSKPRAATPDSTDPTQQPNVNQTATFDLSSLDTDWIDRFEAEGALPSPGSEPLIAPVRLPPVPIEPADRFEVIWPGGEIDDRFGFADDLPPLDPDLDRTGPTARLVRDGVSRGPAPKPPTITPTTTGIAPVPSAELLAPTPPLDSTSAPVGFQNDDDLGELSREVAAWADEFDDGDDDVVSAVRRTVAGIETGSLVTRPRPTDPDAPPPPSPPGATHSTTPTPRVVADMTRRTPTASSVFDAVPGAIADPMPVDEFVANGDHGDDSDDRSSALRRLVGSLRRR